MVERNPQTNIKKIVNIIGKILSMVAIVFVAYAIWKMGFDFGEVDNWYSFSFIIFIGVILKIISVFISASTWTLWLEFWANKKINYIEGICVYTKANIGKYIPGNVMHYVERNIFATKMGISQKKIATSTIMEILCQIAMALFIFVCTGKDTVIMVLSNVFGSYSYLAIIISLVIGIIIVLAICFLLRKKFSYIFAEYNPKKFFATLIDALVRYFFVLSLLGVIMVILFANSGGQINYHSAASIVSGYIVAWVLGFITPGASGGLGVREMVIILLLGPVIGTEKIVSLSVVHRLITIVGDICAYFIQFFIQTRIMGKQN